MRNLVFAFVLASSAGCASTSTSTHVHVHAPDVVVVVDEDSLPSCELGQVLGEAGTGRFCTCAAPAREVCESGECSCEAVNATASNDFIIGLLFGLLL